MRLAETLVTSSSGLATGARTPTLASQRIFIRFFFSLAFVVPHGRTQLGAVVEFVEIHIWTTIPGVHVDILIVVRKAILANWKRRVGRRRFHYSRTTGAW
jgi:hypothetical protein